MQVEVLMWVVSGLCSAIFIFCSVILSKLEKIDDKTDANAVAQSATSVKVNAMEKAVERLPCVNCIH